MTQSTCVSCGADVEPVAGKLPRRCLVCRGKRNRWIIAGLGFAVVAGGIALVVTQLDLKKPATAGAGSGSAGSATKLAVDPDADEDKTPLPTELAAVENCDRKRIMNIVQAYIENDKYVAAVRASKAFQGKCEHHYLLDWKLFYAHEKLNQWKEAEAVVSGLIAHEPNDDDFWWWRGKVRSMQGKHDAAIVDIRQSLADANHRSNGIQIGHLERAAQASKQLCEQAFGLRWLVNVGVELRSSAQREMQQVYLANECEKLDGRGSFEWADKDIGTTKLKGSLAGKNIQFVLDSKLGTTLIGSALADELKLARGTDVDVMLPTGVGTGVTTTADVVVGGARASAVPAVIVEKLPEGYDAVLGLSFLWRFHVTNNGEKYRADPPEQ